MNWWLEGLRRARAEAHECMRLARKTKEEYYLVRAREQWELARWYLKGARQNYRSAA